MLSAVRAAGPRAAPEAPIYLFCHHKVGTVLLSKVFREVSSRNAWDFCALKGQQTRPPERPGVVLFQHATLVPPERPFVGVHLIRDPRDVIVSGYLYHRRTSEAWCVNTDFDATPPVSFPQVPYSQEHRPEAWKAAYLESLGGRSYQEHLLALPQEEGLLFEMAHYGAWTVESMLAWDYRQADVLEVKFEDVMSDYDATFRTIFAHLGFSRSRLEAGLRVAAKHDLSRKSDREVRAMAHVSSKRPGKWQAYFTKKHRVAFREQFGDALIRLGYETDHDW